MRGLFFAIAVMFLLPLFSTSGASAGECGPSPFAGVWQNVRSEVKMLSLLEVEDTCDLDGPYGPLRVRAFEVCHPRPCSWGWTSGFMIGEKELAAEFKTFIAVRRIFALRQGLRLRVVVETDYITETREDTKETHILVLQAR